MNNKKLRFGIIGLGYFGKNYLRLLQEMEGVILTAVAEHSAECLQKLRNQLPPDIKVYNEGTALLSDTEINCVILATPVATHFSLTREALKNGKHVLVEKPMVKTSKEALDLQGLVKESKQVLLVGHQYLYNDYIRKLKEEIDKKIFGKMRYVFAEHLYFGPLRFDVGAFFDAATHELAIMDYLFGPLQIIDVCGRGTAILGNGDDDFSAVEVVFSNGLLFTLVTARYAPQKVRRMVFGGERGMAVYDEAWAVNKLKLFLFPYPAIDKSFGRSSKFFEVSEEQIIVPQVNPREPLLNELEHFINCVRNSQTPLTDIEHGMRITNLLEQILKAITRPKIL